MPLTKALARDPPRTKRFRRLAPVLVLLCLTLLAMVPGILVHLNGGEHQDAARSTDQVLRYEGR